MFPLVLLLAMMLLPAEDLIVQSASFGPAEDA